MAITPRSFKLNPSLLIVAIATAFGLCVMVGLSQWVAPAAVAETSECVASELPMAHWSTYDWATHVQCLSDIGDGEDAYRAASLAVSYYPSNSGLLNLRGFVAARIGDHATAVFDFRTGQRVTGSPSGVFENNIAWSTLYQPALQRDNLTPERAERVLLEARGLYVTSLDKAWSCERVHTGMFVEYAIADLAARSYTRHDDRVGEAVTRYVSLHRAYTQCWNRVLTGDELAVEEILAAAAMDAEMGKLAGVDSPTRHLPYVDTSLVRAQQLGLTVDQAFCEKIVPVAAAVPACVEFAN